ncbi:MAG: hypothetical protein OQL28_05765 [Sedimenticola sp.]|nr:hypothetical protein [Sedimenticola sp.]
MRYLQDASEGIPFAGSGYIQENIERFLQNLKKLELKVTLRASYKLKKFLDDNKKNETEELSADQAGELKEIVNNIRLTLDAEIGGIYAFVTTPKRLDALKLLGEIGELFTPDLFQEFPDIAQYDFTEAGKCIAFERPTAAAFHILRATEANLRHYYKKMVRQKRIASEMWGPIVHDLKARNKSKKHATLNNHLDNIRLSFRNPTQHPEAIYDIHEVQELMSVCIDANNRMFKVLAENR